MMRIGFHMSIAGSVDNAVLAARAGGYTAFQMFTASSRSWKQKRPGEDDAERFSKHISEYDIVPYAHIPYLCNIASPRDEIYAKSKDMLAHNMSNCELLGIGELVIHLGSHLGKGLKFGAERICSALGEALDANKRVGILLENTSGYTNSIGSTFEEIGSIIDTVGSPRIGVCLDTCHAFAAGYAMGSDSDIDALSKDFESNIGFSRLKLVHLNDAKFPLGSKKDRHWHIGEGYIGTAGFSALFRSRHFRSGSFIMETPGNEKGDADRANMRRLRKILESVGINA
ncbi:deoxyribonuclease IV [Candidatus Marsarchaeota archaeon]|nr:deoxyribonuclease IV [Candidatus Marsarchaeota archaeon]